MNSPVLPSVEPGYLHKLLPSEAPEQPETWQDVMKDISDKIMPGMTHWQSPNFHAYYPTQTSYPSIGEPIRTISWFTKIYRYHFQINLSASVFFAVGEIISSGFGVVGFSWICSPACTELEVVVMDWLGKFLNLPDAFLNCSEGPGGGVIQGECENKNKTISIINCGI